MSYTIIYFPMWSPGRVGNAKVTREKEMMTAAIPKLFPSHYKRVAESSMRKCSRCSLVKKKLQI